MLPRLIKRYPELALIPLISLTQWIWSHSGTFWRSGHAGLLGDGWVLHTIACNYLDHGEFSYIGPKATLMQLPGYPFMIAQIYQWFGRDPRWIYGLQILLTCGLTPLLVFHLRPWLKSWRWLFAFLWIFDIHHLIYTTCLTTEFLIYCLWMISWVCLTKGINQNRWGLYSGGIFALGVAAWIKPLSLYILIFFGAALCLSLLKQWKKMLIAIVLALGIYALCLGPLIYRNYLISGECPRYSTISSFNFWYFNIPYFYNMKGEGSVQKIREQQVERMRDHLNHHGHQIAPIPPHIAHDRHAHIQALGINELEYAKIADELSKEFLAQNFWEYLRFHIQHGLQVFTVSNLSWLKLVYQSYEAHSFGFSPTSWWGILKAGNLQSWLLFCRILEVCSTLFFCCLAGVGGLILLIQKRFTLLHGLAWAAILYMPLVCGVNVWGRFRFLIMPMLIFLAVDGIKVLYELFLKWQRSDKNSATTIISK
jgi:hypothetical protein